MEHIRIKKARKSLIYTLLDKLGKGLSGLDGTRTRDLRRDRAAF
ncbi:MAG: hypothetical protein RL013_728 [Bacteroidota bacterium]